jgi:hypothetical protein
VDNIVQFCFKSSSAKRCESSSTQAWIPPPAGLVCVNVDAAVFAAEHRMGLGVVIRDHLGDLKLACSEGIPVITSPEMAEAIAIRRALCLPGVMVSGMLFWLQKFRLPHHDPALKLRGSRPIKCGLGGW